MRKVNSKINLLSSLKIIRRNNIPEIGFEFRTTIRLMMTKIKRARHGLGRLGE